MSYNGPPTAWSFSRWETWSLCPLKYKLQFVDKLPTTQSPSMGRGDRFHKATAAFLIDRNSTIPMPEEFKDHFQQELVWNLKSFSPRPIVEQQWAHSNRWIPCGWMAPMTWLRYIVDVAVSYEDNTLEAIDWKTGKKREISDDQKEIFATALHAKFHADNITTRFVYVDAAVEEIDEFPAKDMPALREKWSANAAKMLSDDRFLPRPNNLCRFCDFSRSKGGTCRFG